MSKALAEILNESEVVLSSVIGKLESLSGFESRDIRLLEEVAAKARYKTAQLGLDPKDTTPKEAYFALLNKFDNDNSKIAKIYESASSHDRLKKIAAVAEESQMGREVWVLKHSVVKSLIRANPPKLLMKRLGYRSLESMLKHEPIEALLPAGARISAEGWSEKLTRLFSKLRPLDFEQRPAKVIVPENTKWEQVSSSLWYIDRVPQLGAVVLWDTPASQRMPVFSLLTLCTQALEDMYKTNLLVRSKQTSSSFGSELPKMWLSQSNHTAVLAGISLHWRSLVHHLASQPPANYPDNLDLNVSPEQLISTPTCTAVSHIHPQLNWWRGSDWILKGASGNQTSFNLVDVSTNYIARPRFGLHTCAAGRLSLWDELTSRYMSHSNIYERIISQLEAGFEPLKLAKAEVAAI